jgi:hypothetical protein
MKAFFLGTFSLITFSCFAQDAANDSSSVTVHKDPRLDLLIKKQSQLNEETNKKKTARGFRLLVVNSNKREDAINAKTKLYEVFPELKTYLYYQAPYFKLKAGNFKDRKEAEDYQKKLNKYFPNGVFLMTDVIELKPEKETEEFQQ